MDHLNPPVIPYGLFVVIRCVRRIQYGNCALYRAEIQRANTWRNRLDTTTNWAILCASAAITFALSEPSRHHGVILFTLDYWPCSCL